MDPLEIANKIKDVYPEDVVDVRQFSDQVLVSVKRDRITDICGYLYKESGIRTEYLADLCGVDYPGRRNRYEVIYNLYSVKHNHRIILKALIPESDPSIDSVVHIWSGANWHEREVCDMYGIEFKGHPDLRRILMPDDWEGFPLRKDYPLKGHEDSGYRSFEELKEFHSHDDEWNIKQE